MRLMMPPVHDLGAIEPPLVVVGDVHLGPAEADVAEHFLAWLETISAGTVVLLGDLFEYWVGAPQRKEPFYARVLAAIEARLARGVRMAFVPGNRDFLFARGEPTSLERWGDPVRATLGSRTVLMTHGDLLCTADVGYQRLRRVLRRRDGQARGWIDRLPYGLRRRLGAGLRGASRTSVKRKRYDLMDIDYGAALRWLEVYDAEVLLAGHVHTGVHHRIETDAGVREVLVLKDWERGGGIIRWDGGPEFRLERPDAVTGSA